MVVPSSGKKTRCSDRRKFQCLIGVVVFVFVVGIPMTVFQMAQEAHTMQLRTLEDRKPMQHMESIMGHHATSHIRSVLEGKYFLVDVSIKQDSLSVHHDDPEGYAYGPVVATFCPLDWRLQKKNPSAVPMFRDLMQQSHYCHPNSISFDLRHAIDKVQKYDRQSSSLQQPSSSTTNTVHTGTTNTVTTAVKPKSLQIGGFVFHESRCGSTLVANLLSAANPEKHRVYSESPPPLTVFRACDSNPHCDPAKQDQLLKDVLYLMGRSSLQKETHVFYKIQSIGTKAIPTVTRAFPDVPWIFVYRDSVETMMSHLKQNADTKRANCLRSMGLPPRALTRLVEESGRTVDSLTRPEFCAAHLATLCEAAIAEHVKSSDQAMGRFVNYQNLPDVMWESVLPDHFNIADSDLDMEGLRKASSVYSKNRGNPAKEDWKDDSMYKQNKASVEVREAANEFLKQRYDRMEELSLETKQ